jgi:eukaryotic-like serine/threonine-protein kinase
MDIVPGLKLGPYEILSPLGAGGMSEVHRALDTRLAREVAVKVLPGHLARDPELLQRFEREAQTLASLSHPNLVTIFDFGVEGNVHFAVMELLEGETLRSRLDREIPEYNATLDIAEAVADGLSAAHSRGIVHRDLKPENIFITNESRVKILDFGLARVVVPIQLQNDTKAPTGPAVTPAGMIMGTVYYMSPEQVSGETADARTDIFSFGAVLYEMVTGAKPFSEKTSVETMVAILRQDPPELGVLQGKIPPDLERIVRACLEKDPAMRFQSAHDLRLALRSVRAGSGIFYQASASVPRRTSKKIDSIAILPFTNIGLDPGMEYLSDGITESIINTLSQLPSLRVMARSTVFRYKGAVVDPRTAGRELGVRAVLTGRLIQRGEEVNIQTELVNVADGSQLWGEQYGRPIGELQNVQEDIANAISNRLQVRASSGRRRRLSKLYTRNAQAYQWYLQGRYHWNKRTAESINKGIEYFNLAIQADPEFALAYAGLADSYSLLGGFGFEKPTEAYPRARAAAERALQLDPDLGEAHASLAQISDRFDRDEVATERHFKRAIRANPGYPTAHLWYAVFLAMLNRFKEAESEINKAAELDPLSVVIHWTKGYLLLYMKRFDDAVASYNKALELDPSFMRALFDLAITYHLAGKPGDAACTFKMWLQKADNATPTLTPKAYALACLGRIDEAHELIREAQERAEKEYVSQFAIAVVHIELGEIDKAFEALERSVAAKEDALISIRVNPRLDPIRNDPRFKELQKRINKT